MAPSAETLGLGNHRARAGGVGVSDARGGAGRDGSASAALAGRPFADGGDLGRYLDRRAVKDAGIFDPLAIALLRQSLKILPARSYAYSLAETLLTLVLSTHVLHGQFCERFDASMQRFCAPAGDRESLARAAVGVGAGESRRGA
jgi:hypothetical protein